MTDHYNTPADFILFYTGVGFVVVMFAYLPMTLIGIVRAYFAAVSKSP